MMSENGSRVRMAVAMALNAAFRRALEQERAEADLPMIELKKPSYFNTGCCAFSDGDVTGLEIIDGEIRLVRWPDDEHAPRRKLLVSAKLADVFAAC